MRVLLFFLVVSLHAKTPQWMKEQIQSDLAPFQKVAIADLKGALKDPSRLNVLVHIHKNKITYECHPKVKEHAAFADRFKRIRKSLKRLSKKRRLPNVTFLLTLHDSAGSPSYPLFAMAKKRGVSNAILFPDCFALSGDYQVLENRDVTRFAFPWEEKLPKLIWRGVAAQGHCTPDNYAQFSRVTLCNLSTLHPNTIDACFTRLAQGADTIPELQTLLGPRLPFEDIFRCKYQMWIDGNTASYSQSGWRFFTRSVIFKPDSQNVQWYFGALRPWEHYVPIKRDLSNLVETLDHLQKDDALSRSIAEKSYAFAVENLTVERNEAYLFALLKAYAKLPNS